ncbi:hypothetical protein MAR_018814, partial [Mya arenaria]
FFKKEVFYLRDKVDSPINSVLRKQPGSKSNTEKNREKLHLYEIRTMSTADVKVVVLRSPNKKKPGYFTLSIDIVPKKNADSVIKKRQKENYEVDECIVPPTSPDIELPLDKDKKCKVKLIIEGGLKPAAVMHDYSEKGARKVLLLVPNNVSDNASIVFKVGGRFKERINIVDVPCQTETVSPGLAALNISGGATSRDSTELKTSYRGGDTSYDAGNLAKPVLPNSGVTSVPDVSDDVVEGAMPVSSTTPTSGGPFPDGSQPLMAKPLLTKTGHSPSLLLLLVLASRKDLRMRQMNRPTKIC